MARKKQFVVIGLGRFGLKLAQTLHKSGAEVIAIDQDQDKVNLADPFVSHAICIDACDEHLMQRAGINNADVAIVCGASHIESSVIITLLCKQMGIDKVVAKAKNELHRLILDKIGADVVVFPEEEMGEKVAKELLNPKMIEVLSLNDKIRIIEMRTPVKWQGKNLVDLDLRNREGISVILIERGEEILVNPRPEEVLGEEDMLVVVGSVSDTDRVSALSENIVYDDEEEE